MKKIILFSLMALSLHLTAQQTKNEKLKGSGNIKSEERTLDKFTAIEVEGCCDVVITQDATQKVSVKTDDNIMSYLKTEVSGGKLRIYFSDKKLNYSPTSATVYISSAFIEDIEVSGSGNVSSTNQLKSKKPHYTISGSGNMKLTVEAEAIETSIAGSGEIDIKGSATSVSHDISGSGNTNATALTSTDVKVDITGSGDCSVNASTSLHVSITGSGDVKYKGSPKITKTIVGNGDVKKG